MSASTFRTNSEEETVDLGRRLAQRLPRPSVVLLIGNLGAGKTTIARGIVEGLGNAASDEVSSPTFTLVHDYGGDVYHIDLYRIETGQEVATLGIEEILDRDRVVVLIEWGERFRHLFPPDAVEIHLLHDGDSRNVSVSGLP